jgi:hypothetical protein
MDDNDEERFLLQQLSPRNIVGVHNYCDRWCERCGFADRCVVNAAAPRDQRPARGDDPLLDHLKDRFDQVRTIVERRSTFSVEELLKNVGDVDAADVAEFNTDEARRDQRLKEDPSLREAQAYMELAHAWFEAESDGMRAHGDALVRRAEVENVDDISLIELARILDAVEINWLRCAPQSSDSSHGPARS